MALLREPVVLVPVVALLRELVVPLVVVAEEREVPVVVPLVALEPRFTWVEPVGLAALLRELVELVPVVALLLRELVVPLVVAALLLRELVVAVEVFSPVVELLLEVCADAVIWPAARARVSATARELRNNVFISLNFIRLLLVEVVFLGKCLEILDVLHPVFPDVIHPE